jgi:hypothetical protein
MTQRTMKPTKGKLRTKNEKKKFRNSGARTVCKTRGTYVTTTISGWSCREMLAPSRMTKTPSCTLASLMMDMYLMSWVCPSRKGGNEAKMQCEPQNKAETARERDTRTRTTHKNRQKLRDLHTGAGKSAQRQTAHTGDRKEKKKKSRWNEPDESPAGANSEAWQAQRAQLRALEARRPSPQRQNVPISARRVASAPESADPSRSGAQREP